MIPKYLFMNVSKRRLAVSLALLAGLLLVGAGCGKKAAAPLPAEQAPAAPASGTDTTAPPLEQPAPVQPQASSDACDHPYYPLKNGYEIDYEITGPASAGLKITVSGVSAGHAKLDTVITYMGSHALSQDLICGADGSIKTNTYMDMASAFGSPFKATTKSVSGEVMPKELKTGDKWTLRYDTELDMSSLKMPNVTTMAGYVEQTNEVIGEEKVSVPAGDFAAIKVRSDSFSHYSVTAASPPTETKSTSFQWYVRGVGLVKNEDVTNKSVMSATKIINP